MGSYTMNIRISNALDFPEMGNGSPFNPGPVKGTAISKLKDKGLKDDYTIYQKSCESFLGISSARNTLEKLSLWGNTSDTLVDITVTFKTGVDRTWRFLGMDIDEDFDAVIKTGSGSIVVGSLFDRKAVKDICDASGSDDVSSFISNLSSNNVRKVATALKTGKFYDMYRFQSDSKYNEGVSPLKDLRSILNDGADSDSDGGSKLTFTSIILNLINKQELSKKVVRGAVDPSTLNNNITDKVLGNIMEYWGNLADKYSAYFTLFSALDLWSEFCKKAVGESDFYSRMRKCLTITDNSTGVIDERVVSFSGVSRNGSVSDSNVIRKHTSSLMHQFYKGFSGNGFASSLNSMDLSYAFRSNVAEDDSSNIFELTAEEAQALSVLDSLRYIDEDASVCKNSYDMNDPEQRGLFIKSAISSYERNFKEFKPSENYDVTSAMADLVERGDVEGHSVLSYSEVAPDDDDSVFSTKSVSARKISVEIDNLLKVMKLVGKSTSKVLGGFNPVV